MTNIISKRRDSGITVTDQFCGAGGSTIGAKAAGLIVREAQNHWKRAIETYAANHQNTRVHHADVSNTDPRKLVTTDLLITSPECTTHSPAGGNRKQVVPQRDMFAPDVDDPKFERSRATMSDVIRYAEYHQYPCIIVENVVEVTKWELFRWWLDGMQLLGYEFKIVNLNSQFCWPTPQSRDRVYIVFWRKGNRAPNLEITPLAHCAQCDQMVDSVQTWKQTPHVLKTLAKIGQPVGKYSFQYDYTCPRCASIVVPFYFAALNAIDLSVRGERIGTKKRPIMPRTRERIAFGLKKFGRRPLMVSTIDGERLASRVRDASARSLFTQSSKQQQGICTPIVVKLKGSDDSHVTAAATSSGDAMPTLVASSKTAALVSHDAIRMMINTRNISGTEHRVRDAHSQTIATQTASADHAICSSPLIVETRHGEDPHNDRIVEAGADPLKTRTAKNGDALITGPAFITTAGSNDTAPRTLAGDAMPTVTCTERLALVVGGSALISLRDAGNYWTGGVDAALRTQTGEQQAALTSIEAVPRIETFPTQDDREIDVDDCFFRMLLDYEIGRGMAFPSDYVVTGTTGERVKQYGNAVTPPAMDLLTRRCAASLAPELAE